MKISGYIVDLVSERIFKGEMTIENSKIIEIKTVLQCDDVYIIPGLIDSHIHIESSMVVPSQFAYEAVKHGTIAAVCDPHEIANVLGQKGIDFMIQNSKQTPFKFFFGCPSCVPATNFETSGATIDEVLTDKILSSNDIYFLAEMMNFPGVVSKDKKILSKINSAKKFKKPIDGHAPFLSGEDLKTYIDAGISTDHECMSIEEAIEKINLGMKIQIREGSAAKDFEQLLPLIDKYSNYISFCSDDKHPDDLIKGHINLLVKRALSKGYNPIDVLKVCSKNVIEHYNIPVGLLQTNDPADFLIIDDFNNFNVLKTYINGILVAENGKSKIDNNFNIEIINKFNISKIAIDDIKLEPQTNKINLIVVEDGQLVTKKETYSFDTNCKELKSLIKDDILKIVVLNRYNKEPASIGFIRGFGMQSGAIASSIAHDSHNIVAVGVEDENIINAINIIIENKGGISVADNKDTFILPLPIAGLMTNKDVVETANLYKTANYKATKLGTKLNSPFMTLAFMSLLVIPELKIGDKGLFDSKKFEFISLFL